MIAGLHAQQLAHSRATVENEIRSAEYRLRMADRRSDLAATLSTIVPQAARIVCEIGCGHGHFLTAYARAHLEEQCIGIDLVKDRIERATRKRDRADCQHLHFIQAEAQMFLETLAPQISFSRVFILFPDPWPKKRHHKNRLFQPEFLTVLANRAGEGTRLYFRTDHAGYFADALAVLQQHPLWTVVEEVWPFEELTVFQARAESYRSVIAQPNLSQIHH